MTKKRFKAGMENLFENASEEPKKEEKTAVAAKKSRPVKDSKKSAGKGFRSDLKSFLQEAFEESLEEQLEAREQHKSARKKTAKPKAGLDALLRSTIEPTKMRLENKPVRRLTITFDEEKLTKLKQIARKERTYLKDIIDEIVGEFLDTYDQE